MRFLRFANTAPFNSKGVLVLFSRQSLFVTRVTVSATPLITNYDVQLRCHSAFEEKLYSVRKSNKITSILQRINRNETKTTDSPPPRFVFSLSVRSLCVSLCAYYSKTLYTFRDQRDTIDRFWFVIRNNSKGDIWLQATFGLLVSDTLRWTRDIQGVFDTPCLTSQVSLVFIKLQRPFINSIF